MAPMKLLAKEPLAEGLRQKKHGAHEDHWQSHESAWNKLQEEQAGHDVHFFDHLEIDKDGGMSEIGVKKGLWYPSRYVTAVLLLVFVFYNISFLIDIDMMLIYPREVPGKKATDEYSLMRTVAGFFVSDLSSFHPAVLVAYVELSLLCLLGLRTCWDVGKIIFCKAHVKWDGVVNLCWEDLPELSIFSCIKMLQYVVPQVLTYDFNYILWYDPNKIRNMFIFLFTRTVVFVVGFDCFLVKVRAASVYIEQDSASRTNIIGSMILLVNILGVVQIGKTVKNRLYRFVFGGEDGIMTPAELVRKDIWEAMVAQRVFAKYPTHKALALMLTWCDDDFQMLTLDEDKRPVM